MTRLAAFLKRLTRLAWLPLLLLSAGMAGATGQRSDEARHQREGANPARNRVVPSSDSYLSRAHALNVLAVRRRSTTHGAGLTSARGPVAWRQSSRRPRGVLRHTTT